jgi:hypothetical protein
VQELLLLLLPLLPLPLRRLLLLLAQLLLRLLLLPGCRRFRLGALLDQLEGIHLQAQGPLQVYWPCWIRPAADLHGAT